MANDKQLDELVEDGSAVVASVDAPPTEMASFAKSALDFRDIPTVATTPATELAGIRSAAIAEAHRVQRDDVQLLWSSEDGLITGMLDFADEPPRLRFHTPEKTNDVDIDFIGTFEFPQPTSAYRFVIDSEDGPWATDWHN